MRSPTASPNRHRIARQVLELDVVSAARMLEVQEATARSFRASPELEALFDRVAGPDEILRLERLELDLGELRGVDWQVRFHARLLSRLEESLEQAARKRLRRETRPTPAPGNAIDSLFQQLLFFLARGRLPWWGGKPALGWIETLAEKLAVEQWKTLADLLRADARARGRLIYSGSDGFLAAVIDALTGLKESDRVFALLTLAKPPILPSPAWRERFWVSLLNFAFAPDTTKQSNYGQGLMHELLQNRLNLTESGSIGDPLQQQTLLGITEQNDIPVLPEPWQGWLEAAQQRRRESEDKEVSISRLSLEKAVEPEPKSRAGSLERQTEARHETADQMLGKQDARLDSQRLNPAADTTGGQGDQATGRDHAGSNVVRLQPKGGRSSQAERQQDFSAKPDADEAIYLDGAGAVILHPFLEELFRIHKLLDGRDFRDQQARQRAVHLVGYLTFGIEQVPEYELLLAKLLCNFSWAEPLPPAELDERERDACEKLLRAVLTHWSALKSSSPAWLREQFLLRDGKLERVDQGWKLTVERRAQDVLLDRLPWGLGLIELPWEQARIHVRWME